MGDSSDNGPKFDAEKDYYAILGVSKTDNESTIKKAHVKLAMENHPDTAVHRSTNPAEEDGKDDSKFREISEAWAVLSKPDLRKAYDAQRSHLSAVKHTTYGYTPGSGGPTAVPTSMYAAQRKNYTGTVKAAAGFKAADKYKTEKWQNMSLAQKKATRVKAVHSPSGGAAGLILGIAFVVGGGYMAYNSMMGNRHQRRHY